MKILTQHISFSTKTQIDFVDITDDVRSIVTKSSISNGTVTIFVAHTTMGVAINHSETMLKQDFVRMLNRIAPISDQYAHDLFELRRETAADGRSNGHSHCKSILLGASECVPVMDGVLVLSPIQSIFAVDVDGPRTRDVVVHVQGI